MVVRLIVFLMSANLICRSTDISKSFIESLGVRDNESRLYFVTAESVPEQEVLKESCCDRSMSVVRRQQFALNTVDSRYLELAYLE